MFATPGVWVLLVSTKVAGTTGAIDVISSTTGVGVLFAHYRPSKLLLESRLVVVVGVVVVATAKGPELGSGGSRVGRGATTTRRRIS